MEIVLQYFEGCPNWRTTAAGLELLMEEGPVASLDYELVDTHEAAVARGFRGSPTVLIDGVDPFADESAPPGIVLPGLPHREWSCRIPERRTTAGSPSCRLEVRTRSG